MRKVMVAVFCSIMPNISAWGMNNYDDPRISTGFYDDHIAGALDILKMTLRASERIEANMYFRNLQDIPVGVNPGYLFSLRQDNDSQNWLLLQDEGIYHAYRVTFVKVVPGADGAVGSAAAATLSLQMHEDDSVNVLAGRIKLSLELDHISYAQDLEYDLSSVDGYMDGSLFVVRQWHDKLSDERVARKIIKPLQLFDALCTGRS